MVKVQKPNPKSLTKEVQKTKKSNSLKKEKLPEAKAAIPSSDNTVKEKKKKLIKKAIDSKDSNAVKNLDKNKKGNDAKLVKKDDISGKIKKKVESKKTAAAENVMTTVNKQNKIKKQKVDNDQNSAKASEDRKNTQKGHKKNNINSAPGPTKVTKNIELGSKVGVGAGVKGKKRKQAAGEKKKNKSKSKAIIEALPFDEEQFDTVVSLKNIKKICRALKTMVEKEVVETKRSIFEDYRYLLTVCSYKIPFCPKRMVKLNLAHSLVDTEEDAVAIIVPDLQRGSKVDYDPTIQHFEDLFRESGITGLKIIPFNQLRQECTTFEAKRKFANTYDYFLCDGRIVSHVVGFAGSIFQKSRTTFHSVKFNDKTTYKREIEKSLKRTAFKQLKRGDLTSIPVGNHRFTVDQLAQNIKLVVEQLKTLYPGGLGNIRNMNIKIDITGTSALPLYISTAAAPADTPSVIGIRERRLLKLKKAANEVLTQFNMSKAGEFVKLDKAQAERKRKIIDARKALLTEDLPDAVACENEADKVPTKKSKKDKTELASGEKQHKALKKQNGNKEEVKEEPEEDEDDTESNEKDDDDGDDDDAGDNDDGGDDDSDEDEGSSDDE